MILYTPHNPDEALDNVLHNFAADDAQPEPSRNGPVLRAPVPVCTTWTPRHCSVSLSPVRDANPFFHLFEACWMLAGRNDVEFLAQYNARMAEFSDDGDVLHGAYGFRWREWFNFDQLKELVSELRRNRATRRAVLTMWSPEGDITQAEGVSSGGLRGKDIPCNTQAYFSIRGGALDMTLMARSNDAVWGAYGANIVHFGLLHGWMAWAAGVPLGVLYQISNDLHIYAERPDVVKLREYAAAHPYESLGRPAILVTGLPPEPHLGGRADTPMDFLAACEDFCEGDFTGAAHKSLFMDETVIPMALAHQAHKAGARSSAESVLNAEGNLWHYAALAWLRRRWAAQDAKAAEGGAA